MNFFLNKKGFNLFSAIVAAILLMTGVILVNMLVTTEETLGSEVYLMTNSFSLSDAAAIARADALQTFNYNFRKQLEDYLTVSDYDIERGVKFNLIKTDDISPGNPAETWDTLKQNFEDSILLRGNESVQIIEGAEITTTNDTFTAAIELVARRTIQQFHDGSHDGRYGRYHVSLNERDNTAIKKLQDALTNTIEENIGEINFLEIVDCTATECNTGTFYFIIPLDRISDEAYEKLPLIIVKDLVSGEEIKFPLLPRTRLNIYIPLRFFKAIHTTWMHNTPAIIEFEGLLSTGQGIQTGMLGYCDNGCEPRTNPLISGGATWNEKNCVGTGITQSISSGNNATLLLQNNSYLIGQNNGRSELNAFARANICISGEAKYTTINYGDPGRLDGQGTFTNYNMEEGRGLEENTSMGIIKASGCPYNRIYAISPSYETKTLSGVGGAGVSLYCTSIRQIEATTIFEDTNPLYIVSGEKNRYAIGIISREFPIQQNNLGQCTSGSNKCS